MEADVHLMQGVRLIWSLLNTGFTVITDYHLLCNIFSGNKKTLLSIDEIENRVNKTDYISEFWVLCRLRNVYQLYSYS